jgi:hypothetical protein
VACIRLSNSVASRSGSGSRGGKGKPDAVSASNNPPTITGSNGKSKPCQNYVMCGVKNWGEFLVGFGEVVAAVTLIAGLIWAAINGAEVVESAGWLEGLAYNIFKGAVKVIQNLIFGIVQIFKNGISDIIQSFTWVNPWIIVVLDIVQLLVDIGGIIINVIFFVRDLIDAGKDAEDIFGAISLALNMIKDGARIDLGGELLASLVNGVVLGHGIAGDIQTLGNDINTAESWHL